MQHKIDVCSKIEHFNRYHFHVSGQFLWQPSCRVYLEKYTPMCTFWKKLKKTPVTANLYEKFRTKPGRKAVVRMAKERKERRGAEVLVTGESRS